MHNVNRNNNRNLRSAPNFYRVDLTNGDVRVVFAPTKLAAAEAARSEYPANQRPLCRVQLIKAQIGQRLPQEYVQEEVNEIQYEMDSSLA